MFQLTIQSREGETKSFLLNREHMTLGSDPGCDVVISSPYVPPVVAGLAWENGLGFRLLAAPGQQTLMLNGQPVTSALLEDGDQIRTSEFAGIVRAVSEFPEPAPGSGAPREATRTDPLGGMVHQLRGEVSELRALLPLVEDLQRRLDAASVDAAAAQSGLQAAKSELDALRAESLSLREELDAERGRLERTSTELEAAQAENVAIREELAGEQERATKLAGQLAVLQQGGAGLQIKELESRLAELEGRLMEADADGRRRMERAHETIANLRKVTAQQDGEIREQRQAILKLQQAKNAAETQLESIRKTYSRDRKQHGRLLDQFRERARRETARADMALHELARSRQPDPEPELEQG